ncbi:MAG: acyltransferase domain-containing protein [Acetobacteraceae bacterium]
MPRTIMMFCGQGAQYYQMGRELYQQDTIFRQAMDRCDEIARDLGGRAVSDIVFGRPLAESDRFDRLSESNIALLGVSHALALSLFERGVMPHRLLGYSLGETIAATVAGVLSLEEGLRLVYSQARLFETLSPEGAMVAVLAAPERMRDCPEIAGLAEVTAVNAPNHFVLSLLIAHLPAVTAALDRIGVTWARLPVRYPFHADPIGPLAEPMRRLTGTFQFHPPRFPLVSAATAARVDRFDGSHVWRVMRGRLRFRETIEALSREGDWVLVEAGPSGTLVSFTRQIRAPGITAWPSIDQFGQNDRTMRQAVAAAT